MSHSHHSSKLSRRSLLFVGGAMLTLAACNPVSLVQRAVEARSVEDIATDNRIVVGVNRLMAKYKTVSVSTEIYEQRLLIYGIMEDAGSHAQFRQEVDQIAGIKTLYWHVEQMSEAQQTARSADMIGFAGGLKLKAQIEANWLNAEGVESVNFRVAVDPFGTAYVLGRAKTSLEQDRAIAVVGNTERVRRVRNYTVVR